MKQIRSTKLPEKLVTFAPLSNYIRTGISHRLIMLSKLSGYPSPSSVINRIQMRFDLTSNSSVQGAIKKLRDIVSLAAEMMPAINQLKVSRMTLNYAPIMAYVKEQAVNFYYDLNDDDLLLATYLIASSSLTDYNWSLIQPKLGGKYDQFRTLYFNIPTADKSSLTAYDPSSDKIRPFDEIPYVIASKERATKYADTMPGLSADDKAALIDKVQSAEAETLRLANMRLIDHIMMLFTDFKIWDTFLPARTADTPQENIERMEGLSLFAGYLHSLLLLPSLFHTEMYRQTYDRLETWLGDFPLVSPEVEVNYKNIINAYDVLKVSEDVRNLFAIMEEKSSLYGSTITILPDEYTHVFRMNDIISKAKAKVVLPKEVALTDLKALRQPSYAHVILSLSIARTDFRSTITSKLLDSEIYKLFMIESTRYFQPQISRYIPPKIKGLLEKAALRVPFTLSSRVSVVPDPMTVSSRAITENTISHKNGTLPGTYDIEYKLRDTMLYHAFSSTKFIADNPNGFLFDNHLAAYLRGKLMQQWRSLYPGNLEFGIRSYTRDQFQKDNGQEITIQDLVETISGQHIEQIRRSFVSPYVQQIWATFLSSFALLYVSPSGEETKAMKSLALVEGLGLPYGVTFTALAALQHHQDKDLVHAFDGVYLVFLKKIPKVSENMVSSTFYLDEPYQAFSGSSATVDASKNLVWSEGLLQYGIKPFLNNIVQPVCIFDRLQAYINDSVILQDEPAMKLPSEAGSDYEYHMALKEQSWPYDKFDPHVRFIYFGAYGSGPSADSFSAVNQNSLLTEAVDKMEKDIEKAKADTPEVRVADEAKGSVLKDANLDTSDNKSKEKFADVNTAAPEKRNKRKKSKSKKDEKDKESDVIIPDEEPNSEKIS